MIQGPKLIYMYIHYVTNIYRDYSMLRLPIISSVYTNQNIE